MEAFGRSSVPLMVPGCHLIDFGFAALGMAATLFLATFQQMDWLTLFLMPMFLFSATFYPHNSLGGPRRVNGHIDQSRS